MTIPAIPVPEDGRVRTPLELRLRPGWRFDTKRRTFTSDSGERFSPFGELPAGSRIVYSVPQLAKADVSRLNEHERELRRYMQLILPAGASPARYVARVGAWPPVEAVHVGPEVSLPRP